MSTFTAAAEKVRKVHHTGGQITLITPEGKRHRCSVPRLSTDGKAATFEWRDHHGTPQRVTLRIDL